jgi:hypothetical protein
MGSGWPVRGCARPLHGLDAAAVRAAPAVQVLLAAEPGWRLSVGALAGAATAAVLAWAHGHGLASSDLVAGLSASPVGPALVGTFLSLAVAVLAWRHAGLAPYRLVWDGQAWSCAELDRSPWACAPSIALDLGSWLLIRAQPLPDASARRRVHWLAVSRRTAAEQWHPLRVALQAQTRPHRSVGGARSGGMRAP